MRKRPKAVRPIRRGHSRQRGAIIVWFALFMMTMLSFVALGIDIAKLSATRTQLQNAADAAALAGVSAIDPLTGKLDPALAVRRAQAAGALNEAFVDEARPVLVDAADVQLLGGHRVKVTVRRRGPTSVVTSMAHVLGIKSMDTQASAVAKADTANAVCNVVPLGIFPPAPWPMYQAGCGKTYVFKFGNLRGGNANYRPITLPPCYDGPCGGMSSDSRQAFECQMKNGYRCCLTIKEWVFVERRNWTEPLRNAIDARFAEDVDRREGICYADYRGNGRRVMFLPIMTPEVTGDPGAWVTNIEPFFIKGRLGAGPGAALVGEFIHAVAPASPGGHPESGGPVTFALHLVR
jgi:Flp pilus assembly protein TadG